MPSAFWGPEKLDSAAFVELVALFSPDVEIAAILVALKDIKQVVDVGGGTGCSPRRSQRARRSR